MGSKPQRNNGTSEDMLGISHSRGGDSDDLRPQSLAQALEFTSRPKCICNAVYPYPLIYANKAWTKLTKYEQHEIEGRTLGILRGELTAGCEFEEVSAD
jgi:hypothetical protein